MKKMRFNKKHDNIWWTDSTSLLSYPSVFKSMARIMDMWGSLDEYKYSESEEKADLSSLRRDYLIAMHDLKNAQQTHDHRRTTITAQS